MPKDIRTKQNDQRKRIRRLQRDMELHLGELQKARDRDDVPVMNYVAGKILNTAAQLKNTCEARACLRDKIETTCPQTGRESAAP